MAIGSHDRRGFDTYMYVALAMIPISLLLMPLYSWTLGLGLALFFCIAFTTLETVSARPDNNPSTFLKWSPSQTRRRPVLLCLGDSLLHGNCSASITPEVPLQLCRALGLPTPDYGKTFADPLWVVNGGQNGITAETVLQERLGPALNVFPDYILILIGTNDVLAMYQPHSWGKAVVTRNRLTTVPSLTALDGQLTAMVQRIRQGSVKVEVGVCTLPPLGEDLTSRANGLVRQANAVIERVVARADDRVTVVPVFDGLEGLLEKQKGNKGGGWPIDWWRVPSTLLTPIHQLTMFKSWNMLSKPFGYYVLSDGVHLNERGRDCVVDLIVEWLTSKSVAKAIAVKS